MLLSLIFPSFTTYVNGIGRMQDAFLTALVVLLYYLLMESATGGRSIGKYLTKTKVVDEDGGKPDFSTFLKRNLCRFIPFEAFSFLGSEEGWHDSISGTRVVDIP